MQETGNSSSPKETWQQVTEMEMESAMALRIQCCWRQYLAVVQLRILRFNRGMARQQKPNSGLRCSSSSIDSNEGASFVDMSRDSFVDRRADNDTALSFESFTGFRLSNASDSYISDSNTCCDEEQSTSGQSMPPTPTPINCGSPRSFDSGTPKSFDSGTPRSFDSGTPKEDNCPEPPLYFGDTAYMYDEYDFMDGSSSRRGSPSDFGDDHESHGADQRRKSKSLWSRANSLKRLKPKALGRKSSSFRTASSTDSSPMDNIEETPKSRSRGMGSLGKAATNAGAVIAKKASAGRRRFTIARQNTAGLSAPVTSTDEEDSPTGRIDRSVSTASYKSKSKSTRLGKLKSVAAKAKMPKRFSKRSDSKCSTVVDTETEQPYLVEAQESE